MAATSGPCDGIAMASRGIALRIVAMPIRRAVAFALALTLGLASPCLAGSRQLSGAITDGLGRPLTQVKVELRDANGRAIAHATSDTSGRFGIAPAKPGVYSLVAVKAGFKPANKIVSFPGSAGATIAMTLDAQTALTVPVQASLIRAPEWRLHHRRQ